MMFWSRRKIISERAVPEAALPSERGARFDPSRPLAFMHIPKTAGSSLIRALARSVPDSNPVTGLDRSLYGLFDDFGTLGPAQSAAICHSTDSFPRDARLIMGHFAYSTLRGAYPDAQIITVLRDPTSRLLSHWLFWRQHTDDMLEADGGWADFVRYSREPLADFLNQPRIAPQIDNAALRMILWQHPLIGPDRFIDPAHDELLLREAAARLETFAFIDVIENKSFIPNLQGWLDRPLPYEHVNETSYVPPEYRVPLHRELTDTAYDLISARSRLDLQLWRTIAEQRMKGRDAAALQQRIVLTNIARYGALMSA